MIADTPLWLILLGPPLAGKSTLGSQLVDERNRFSVRTHFEPRRATDPTLPPLGTLLPNSIVWSAVEHFLSSRPGEDAVLDGFPTSASQADALAHYIERCGASALWIWLDISAETAATRAQLRLVCTCDGLVDDARAIRGATRCRRCGAHLKRRPDDVPAGFAARWRAYANRAGDLRRRAPIGLEIDGEALPLEADSVLDAIRAVVERNQ